jgi:hypothetical protein
MMIHKERIGCDTNETRRGELRQRLQQKNVLIANLNSRRSDYQGRYSVVPMNDWNMCVARGNSLVDPDRAIEALNGWGLTEVEAALSALAQPAGPAGAPTVTVVVAGPGGEAAAAQQPPPTIWPLLDNVCQKHNDPANGASTMSALSELQPLLQRLGNFCTELRGNRIDQLSQMRDTFFVGIRPLSASMVQAVRNSNLATQSGPAIQNACLTGLQPAPERGRALYDMAGLERQIRDFGDPQAELDAANQNGRVAMQNDSGTELFNEFRGVWTRGNGTGMNLTPRLNDLHQQILAECNKAPDQRGGPIRPETNYLQGKISELHGACLLNAGVYLYGRTPTPVFTSREAGQWNTQCQYFLQNNQLSPQFNDRAFGVNPAPSADQYNEWQCNAFNNFADYRSNLTNSLSPPGIVEFCNSIDRDPNRTQQRNAGVAGVAR